MSQGILEFCSLLGKLKHLKRTGWVRNGIKEPETVAGHMYRMAVLAFLLDDDKVDKTKCIKMALVHDMAEAIVGDITPHCGITLEDKIARERDGFNIIKDLLPPAVGEEFISLWEEYEALETPEAKAVRDLDKFDMIAQAEEYEISENRPGALAEFFKSTEGIFQHETVLAWVEQLKNSRAQRLSTGGEQKPSN